VTTAQRIAALVGSAALAVSGLTALTVAPAAAADGCHSAATITKDWGKVTFTRCFRDPSSGHREYRVQGTLTDTKTDGCNVRVKFTFKYATSTHETGNSKSFQSLWHIGSPGVSLSKVC
jgi:hypothetical protein